MTKINAVNNKEFENYISAINMLKSHQLLPDKNGADKIGNDSVLVKFEEMLNEEILKNHPFRIWQAEGANDHRWKTYVYNERTQKRKLLAKPTREQLAQSIVEYETNKANKHVSQFSIKTLYQEWIAYALKMQDIEKNTANRYQNDYDKFISGTEFETMDIRYIKEREIRNFLKNVVVEHYITKKAFSNLNSLVKGIFRYAKSERDIECVSITTAIEEMKIPNKHFKHTSKEDAEEVFTQEEIQTITNRILSKYKEDIRFLGILLMAQTGIRIGELVSLECSDYKNGNLYITKTEQHYKDNTNGKEIYTVKNFPKSESSIRAVILSNSAIGTLHLIENIRKKNGITSSYLFCDKNENRLHVYHFSRKLKYLCNESGIPYRKIHSLRKTYASLLRAQNVDGKIIQKQLGHKNISTTQNYYSFLTQTEDNIRNILNENDFLKKD